jgi:hypothetical protein
MNERIEKLLEQCQIETYGVNGELLEIGFDAEKFAKMIVKECIELNNQELSFNAFERLLNKYQNHFGVEL